VSVGIPPCDQLGLLHTWVLNESTPGSTCQVCGLKDKYTRRAHTFVPIHPAAVETFEDSVVREEMSRMHRFEHLLLDTVDWHDMKAQVYEFEVLGYELVSFAVAHDPVINRQYYVAAMKRPRSA
jgi:hypothetical protein